MFFNYGTLLRLTGLPGYLQVNFKNFREHAAFPKKYKYTHGQDMKRDALQLVRSIYWANKPVHKKEYLETFADDFELLKLEIRLCMES